MNKKSFSLRATSIYCLLLCSTLLLLSHSTQAQIEQELETAQDSIKAYKEMLDSLYIEEVENVKQGKPKVLHAEPLYIDLIRDLGARKGENEWNVGIGIIDNADYTKYEALVEYEFALIDRLGLEIEFPFSIYYGNTNKNAERPTPLSRMNSIKLATQWSFWVSEKYKTTMALGYLHEFEMIGFKEYGKKTIFSGNLYNPFWIAAKRWGNNWHTLLYTGPLIEHHFNDRAVHTAWQINTNFHYMIPGTRNFIGIEANKNTTIYDFDLTLRPQMRVGLADNLLVGIVTGIPIKREKQRFSTFIRIIYEPKHRHIPHK